MEPSFDRFLVGGRAAGEQKGGAEEAVGASPTDRGKLGCKRHIIVDGHGTPLGVVLSGANVHDSKMLEEVIDSIPAVRSGRPGKPRFRPKKVYADIYLAFLLIASSIICLKQLHRFC